MFIKYKQNKAKTIYSLTRVFLRKQQRKKIMRIIRQFSGKKYLEGTDRGVFLSP
jgi:hypothetical protein